MSDKDLSKKAANEQLMACPFCGGKARVHNYEYIMLPPSYGIICGGCGAKSRQLYGTMGEAVNAWNTRVPASHEMTAKELLLTEERMLRDDDYAFGDYTALLCHKKMDKAVAFAEQWAREHSERSDDK